MKTNHILNFFIFLLILINPLKAETKQADIIKQIQNRISDVHNSNNNKERFKNSFKYINFSNNNTNTKNNGFAQWIEENTCVFCVTVVLLVFALFIFISLIIVRFACEKKKKIIIPRNRPPPAHVDFIEDEVDDDDVILY